MSSSDLRVGMVSWDFTPFIGGMGRHVETLVAGLRSCGVEVSVLSRVQQKTLRPLKHLSFSLGLLHLLPRWIRENGITLLHVHTGPGGVFLIRKPRIPLVVTANHTYFQQARLPGQGWKRLLIPFERRTYALADHIICISADTALVMESAYRVPRAKLSVIPCGIPLAPWRMADCELSQRLPHAVFVGRPDTRKGWLLLLSAWSRVRAARPHAQLHVVGCVAAPVPGVVFHGRVSDEELHSLVGSSRCLVCPSAFEGFGLAAAEAIAAGTPVVATNVAGLRLLVGQRTGVLVSSDAADIAAAVIRCLSDDAFWHQLHAGCRAKRATLDLDGEVRAHRELYRALYSTVQ